MLQLHNSMWPGIVGKGEGSEPILSLDRMVQLTRDAQVENQTFDGIDLNIMDPHVSIALGKDEILRFADGIQERGLKIGSIGAPIWPGTGGGSAMGSQEERQRFLDKVKQTCQFGQVLREHGIRQYGSIRIDSADSPAHWATDPASNMKKIINTFTEAAKIAGDYGERLAAEGEICWAGMHSWYHNLELMEAVGMPEQLGFQADLAHTYLFLLGYNADEHALVGKDHSEAEFWEAYGKMTQALAPWTIDFHVAQSNGTVFGSGSHDKTGRHCPADAPDGKLDVVKCARYWLLNEQGQVRNNIQHICWDGCMFPNATLENQETWNKVLALMLEIREDIGA